MITLIVWGAYNAAMHNSTVVEGRIFGVVSLFAVQDNSLFTVYRKNLFTPGTNCGKISLILFGGHSAMHSALTTKKTAKLSHTGLSASVFRRSACDVVQPV